MDKFDRLLMRQLGSRIKRRRRYLEISQEALAERIGLHRTQISLYEKGEQMPATATLFRLARALGLSVGRLVVGIEWDARLPPLPRRTEDDGWDPRQDEDDAAEET